LPRAQLAPNRPIRIIVPFAPAGSSDVLARLLQSPLQQALGQTVIVENRAGAGANIGMVEAARAEPDGYTLLLTSSALVVNPALYKNVAYDPAKDFAPIATLPVAPNILAVNTKGSINSLSEVVARAKAEPGKLNYASPGNGTTPQLAMELFKLKAGLDITLFRSTAAGRRRRRCSPVPSMAFPTSRSRPSIFCSRRPGRRRSFSSVSPKRRWR
jgi:tripartite-type tricarboxylate transporter receptor subunit TctC